MRDRRIVPYNLHLKGTSRTLRRDRYVVDFYCSRLQLVIEIDGDSHFTEAGKAYDAMRTAILERLDVKVLRFANADVTRDFEGVCSRIGQVLAGKT